MNARGFLTGFALTLAVLTLLWVALGGPIRERANADGRKKVVPEYRRPFDVSKEALRRALLAGLKERVVLRRYFAAAAIGETGDRFFVSHLITRYAKETDTGVKGQILTALGKLGGADAERHLLSVLESVVGPTLAEAASAVGYLPGEAALRGLERALQAKNTFVRVRAVDGIVNAHRLGVEPLLDKALGDPQYRVRQRVVERLGDLLPPLRRHVLAVALKADRPALRAEALKQWLEAGNPPLPGAWVLKALEDPSPGVRAQAARVAGRLGLKKALPRLLALISPKAPEELLAAVATALGELGDPQAVEGLLRIAEMEPFIPRGDALLALGRVRWQGARERLRKALTDEKPYVRHRAALALHLLGEPGMVPFFEQSLASDDLVTRTNCVYTLGEEHRPEFIPVLVRAIREDKDPKVREVAVKSLAGLLPQEGALEGLRLALRDGAPEVRYWAMQVIEAHPSQAVLPLVREATQDENWDVRRRAYRYLAAHDPQGSLSYLRRGAKDVDWRVKAEVWGRLYRILYGKA